MNKFIALALVLSVACPTLSFADEGRSAGGSAAESTTVKSGKSNSSERSGGNAAPGAVQGTTVKSSKSNSNERSGGNAGGSVEGTTVKSSKSNSQD